MPNRQFVRCVPYRFSQGFSCRSPQQSRRSFASLRMTVRRSVLHVIRSVTAVMLSGAKHLSYHSVPLSFRPSGASGEIFPIGLPPVIFVCPTLISTVPASCHFDRALPTVISTERSEWRNLFVARHRRRNIRPPTPTVQALRGARPQKALLAPGCCLLATYYVHVPARRVEKSYGNGVLGH